MFAPKAPEVSVPISVSVSTAERGERKQDSVSPGSSEGRFFHMEKRLCKMGIGFGVSAGIADTSFVV